MSYMIGLIALAIAIINAVIGMTFAIKKEEDKIVKSYLAYGSMLMLFSGIATLLFEMNMTLYAEVVMLLAFSVYMFVIVSKSARSRHQKD